MSKTIYLAGPMKGLPYFNFPTFHKIADKLRQKGYIVFNPAETASRVFGPGLSTNNPTGDEGKAKVEYGFDRRRALASSLYYICAYADAVYVLPGWRKSSGCLLEMMIAHSLDLEVTVLDENGNEDKDENNDKG